MCEDEDDEDDEEHNHESCQFKFLMYEVQKLQLENTHMRASIDKQNPKKRTLHEQTQTSVTKKTSNVGVQTDHVDEVVDNKYHCSCGVKIHQMHIKRHLNSIKHKVNIMKKEKKTNDTLCLYQLGTPLSA